MSENKTRIDPAGRSCLAAVVVATLAAACDLAVPPMQSEAPETAVANAKEPPPVPDAASGNPASTYTYHPLGQTLDVVVYVDGVRQDQTDGIAGLDPKDIERIEVLRTRAGVEAMDGVAAEASREDKAGARGLIQIFTKREAEFTKRGAEASDVETPRGEQLPDPLGAR